ncbi:MAG: ATP-binding protein [Gammaproteobacteria bacterium]|nr:ATP-binding protein [Gammaproteobacteria bacterium]
MDSQFALHNTHLEGVAEFAQLDPQLRMLARQKYVYEPKLLTELPINEPGIYTLTGGRQIGKTTLLKQWMARLLAKGIDPRALIFFSGELIDDQHQLYKLFIKQLKEMPTDEFKYLIIDEVTYIKDWDKAVKYIADAGLLENMALILTGSDSVLIQQARMRFPGRRGRAEQVNFHLYPLSFRETLVLKGRLIAAQSDAEVLFQEFNNYLQHGGYLTAINELAMHNRISGSILDTYADWVRGDMLKRGKQESYLAELITAIIKCYGSQISWHSLAKDLSIAHHKTVADYVELLASMDVVYVQSALVEDKLVAAPKKAKKLIFTDPFIFHALNYWLHPIADPYHNLILPVINDEEKCSKLVEACAVSHYRRYYPTYYIKAEGEVDIAYVDDNKFWLVEVKWTKQLRPKDLSQVAKYNNSLILTKQRTSGVINGVDAKPLPLVLLAL